MDSERSAEATVAVVLHDALVQAAAVSSLEGSGIRVVPDPSSAHVCVSDEGAAPESPSTVLVVPATPAACAGALPAVMSGQARGAATDADLDLLATVVRSVAGGVVSITPRVVSLADELPDLTRRELEVLRLVAEGMPLLQVARRLHVSHATVKRELTSLFATLGVSSRVALVLQARRLGLLAPDASREGDRA